MPTLTVVLEQLLAPIPGGTGRYAREITTALAADPPPGWDVQGVTAFHRDPAAAAIPGAAGPRRLAAGHRVLAELWMRGLPPYPRGDRIHATTPLAPGGRTPIVTTVHDAVPWTHPELLTPRGVRWHRSIIGRQIRRADAIVVPSLAVADDLAGIFPAASDRLVVVPHGVTALPAPADAAERRRRLGLPDRYVTAVATLEPRKGLDVLVRAIADPAADGIGLVVVGPPGWGGVDLAGLARAAGLPPGRVVATGRIDDADLGAVLDGAAVLAAPSRSEGFGLPVLEAMAAGVPVVTSDAPALVELVGPAGLVARREDATALAVALATATEPDTAAALAAAGRARSAEFTWAAAAAAVWKVHTA